MNRRRPARLNRAGRYDSAGCPGQPGAVTSYAVVGVSGDWIAQRGVVAGRPEVGGSMPYYPDAVSYAAEKGKGSRRSAREPVDGGVVRRGRPI
jgi:hypothetical protein